MVCNTPSYPRNDRDTEEAALAEKGTWYLIHPVAITFPSKEDRKPFDEKQYGHAVYFINLLLLLQRKQNAVNKKLLGKQNYQDRKLRSKLCNSVNN